MPKKSGGRTTRKNGRDTLSVENLHATFEKMDTRLRQAVESGITDHDLAVAIDRAWSAAFHNELSAPAVKGLVQHYRALYGKTAGGRKTRKARRRGQVGGAATIGWTMGQGTTATTNGLYPMDLSTSNQGIESLGMTRSFNSPISSSCDLPQKGGGIFDSLLAGFPPASIPHNMIQTTVSTLQGAPITNPPSAPEVPSWDLSTSKLTPFDGTPISNLSGFSTVYKGY